MLRSCKGHTCGRLMNRRAAVWPTALVLLMSSTARVQPQDTREAQAVQRALRHVPGPMAPVVVIDPELAPDPLALRGLDAFVVRELDGRVRQRIYVNARSPILRGAVNGSPLSLAVLSAVLHHEMQHLQGRSEPEARAAERALFARLVEDGVVARWEGARFLEQFDRQPPPRHDVAPGAPGRPRMP